MGTAGRFGVLIGRSVLELFGIDAGFPADGESQAGGCTAADAGQDMVTERVLFFRARTAGRKGKVQSF